MTDDMRKKLIAKGLSSLPPLHQGPSFNPRGAKGRNFNPLPWSDFFDEKFFVETRGGKCRFNLYSRGQSSALDEPVVFLLHGGGYSGLSWACFAKILTQLITCRVIALDSRGHGSTVTDDDYDLSADTQTSDVIDVINRLSDDRENTAPIFLIGHSMGGAVAVRVAHKNVLPNLIGLAVIDVVEGSAMDSLSCMQTFLRSRPQNFKSVESAIEWCVRSGQVKNFESARVSMPGQIVQFASDAQVSEDSFDERAENADSPNNELSQTVSSTCYRWRIDLPKTEGHWTGWFAGLSSLFLQCPQPKLLLLAGVDRLDKELTMGQMRGQFQMVVVPRVGHCVHEDSPDKVAEIIASFLVRNRLARPTGSFQPLPPVC